MSIKNFAILIPSCDKYSDVWEPLFFNLKKMWPNIKVKVYLISNHKDFYFDKVKVEVLKIGDDISWSSNLKKALMKIEEDNIFLLIDDLFFKTSIDEELIYLIFKKFEEEEMNYFRFNPTPGPSKHVDKIGIGEVLPGDYYRSSTVIALWRKKVLIEVLDDSENAWEFELVGSSRTDKYDKWYASCRYLMPVDNLIIKGKYDPDAFERVTNRGISLSSLRPMMNSYEHLQFKLKKFRSRIFDFLPHVYKRRIRKLLLKL